MTNMEWLVKKGISANDLTTTRYGIDKEHGKETFHIFDLNATISRLFTVSISITPCEAILEWLGTEYVTDIITDFERKKLNNWLTAIREIADIGSRISINGIRIVRFDENNYYIPASANDNDETKVSDVYIEIEYRKNNEGRYHYERFLIDKDTEFVHLNYRKKYSLADLGIEREDCVDE